MALSGAKDNVKAARLKDGSLVYIVKRLGPSTDRILTPDEFSRLYYDQQTGRGWLSTVFNVTSPVGLVWVAIGLSGQLLFTGECLSNGSREKSKRSVVPVSFWWMSLIGATMLLVYFIWRRDIVGILGQATGWVIYVRNLALIKKAEGRIKKQE